MHETDLFGEPVINGHKSVLARTFDYPPFSVLNARDGWWQDRKRQWLALGIKSEVGRGAELIPNGGGQASRDRYAAGQRDDGIRQPARAANMAAPGGSARPACDYRNRQRGDGAGRAI